MTVSTIDADVSVGGSDAGFVAAAFAPALLNVALLGALLLVSFD